MNPEEYIQVCLVPHNTGQISPNDLLRYFAEYKQNNPMYVFRQNQTQEWQGISWLPQPKDYDKNYFHQVHPNIFLFLVPVDADWQFHR